ncbi:MAG: molybdopterin-dependent oxidoreductase, partial [Gemmatimonadales bacterium]|nr:molybdopterin-dependent oxidoreductase [Gemmatimonadales bacterium]
MATIMGSGIRRREDPRLITGNATYTDDVALPGMTYAAFLRSPYAHATIRRIDVAPAKAAPGVVAVYTGADVAPHLVPVPCAWNPPNCDLKVPAHPLLATEKVRYVGDAVAMVVATSRAAARDAIDLIDVDYDALGAETDPEKALQPGAPQFHADVPGNKAFQWEVAGGDTDAAFRDAEVTAKLRIVQQRLLPTAIETRGAVASYNKGTGQLTLWSTSQNPHIHRFLCSVMLKLPEHRVRVIAPEVGGGFGSKIPAYADEALVSFASMQLGRPVKWSEDRSENYKVT